jgi:GNAT superfamily N-acetyltransferase
LGRFPWITWAVIHAISGVPSSCPSLRAVELQRDGYTISDDPERVDIDATWGFLRTSYWSPGVAREVVERSIAGSLCFGLYAPDGSQAGFARAVTDRATFAWIADLFVLEAHQGRGLGVWLVESILGHPDLAGLRQIVLATDDAHGLYRRFGFEAVDPERYMIRRPPEADA